MASQLPSTCETQSRPLYNFPPDIWRDRIASITFDQDKLEWYDREVEVLKSKVEAMLKNTSGDAVERIKLIDLLCRLGLSYHFQAEIDRQLHHLFRSQFDLIGDRDHDIYTITIIFRVFRQHGIKISCDVFNKFKDAETGKFKDYLIDYTLGLLSLFEAAHLSTHEEDILDEALAFTMAHLELLARISEPNLAKFMASSLKIPLHRRPPSLKAREFISFYEEGTYCQPRNDTLLRFAKLDFNRVQLFHQQELKKLFKYVI